MRDDFKSWRRKLGVVTLAIVCLLATGWIRSIRTSESIIFDCLGQQIILVSACQRFVMLIVGNQLLGVQSELVEAAMQSQTFRPVNKRTHTAYFFFYRFGHPATSARVFRMDENGNLLNPPVTMIPYWTIVVPMTLVSAWLLLSKPSVKRDTMEPDHA